MFNTDSFLSGRLMYYSKGYLSILVLEETHLCSSPQQTIRVRMPTYILIPLL